MSFVSNTLKGLPSGVSRSAERTMCGPHQQSGCGRQGNGTIGCNAPETAVQCGGCHRVPSVCHISVGDPRGLQCGPAAFAASLLMKGFAAL